jgi:hypothetical protein
MQFYFPAQICRIPSFRELAKEIQRQEKAKTLAGGSQTLIRVAQKYEEQKMKLKELEEKARAEAAARARQEMENSRDDEIHQIVLL